MAGNLAKLTMTESHTEKSNTSDMYKVGYFLYFLHQNIPVTSIFVPVTGITFFSTLWSEYLISVGRISKDFPKTN